MATRREARDSLLWEYLLPLMREISSALSICGGVLTSIETQWVTSKSSEGLREGRGIQSIYPQRYPTICPNSMFQCTKLP